jgi:DNA-directed RNA polymerase specialized sigma subunit
MRQHQRDVAALEQWTPAIHKLSFKAAQRAAKIGSSLRQDDFKQELSITLLKAIDAYNPDNEAGAKFITFFYRSAYNEINKLLRKDDYNMRGGQPIGDYTMQDESEFREVLKADLEAKGYTDQALKEYDKQLAAFRSKRQKTGIRTISGDHIAESDDGGSVDVWGYVEDDSERPIEYQIMDDEIVEYVRARVSTNTRVAMDMLLSGEPWLMQQLQAFNAGCVEGREEGDKRRVQMNLDLKFVASLLGKPKDATKAAESMGEEIKAAIKAYAPNERKRIKQTTK